MDFFCQNTQCGKRLQAGGLQPGTSVRCPACGHVQAVPEDRGDIIDLPDPIADVLPADASVGAQAGAEPEDAVRAGHGAARRRSRSRRRVYLDLLCPYCGEVVLVSDMECPACKKSLHDIDLEQEEAHLKRQRLLSQVLSFALGLPGFVLINAAFVLHQELKQNLLTAILGVAGALLLCAGIAFATLYKRFNPAWAVAGLLGCVGLIVLALLPDQKQKRMVRIRGILNHRDRLEEF